MARSRNRNRSQRAQRVSRRRVQSRRNQQSRSRSRNQQSRSQSRRRSRSQSRNRNARRSKRVRRRSSRGGSRTPGSVEKGAEAPGLECFQPHGFSETTGLICVNEGDRSTWQCPDNQMWQGASVHKPGEPGGCTHIIAHEEEEEAAATAKQREQLGLPARDS